MHPFGNHLFLEVKMETKYDFNLVEKGKYEFWLNNKTF